MTDFIETDYRHYCRNPKCRTKLPTPVSHSKEAFCSGTSCKERFYRLRCYVCEEKKPAGKLRGATCGKRRCRNAFRVLSRQPGYRGSDEVEIGVRNPIESGTKTRLESDRGVNWAIAVNQARIRAPRRVLEAECAGFLRRQ
jgi:hypothetical protein